MCLCLALGAISGLVASRRHELHDLVHSGSELRTGVVVYELADFELVKAKD
jgi:hypothetical protein